MSNSSLVDYTCISPNRTSPRNHIIDTITIHCTAGQCTAEGLGAIFAPTSRQASSNYGVDKNGRIGLYVEEKDRSWCSSNAANDNRAITIEVSSDAVEPCAVSAKAYAALIDLLVDICKRNNIKKLVWSEDKNERMNHLNGCNMTVHRDYSVIKTCPGTYLYERHGAIASAVNQKLGVSTSAVSTPVVPTAPASYEKNGLTFIRADNFAVVYHDANKRKGAANRYVNGGFFATYKDSGGAYFTLPVGNLVCDVGIISKSAEKYLSPYIVGNKLWYSCNNNQSSQFHGKVVSTLVVPKTGIPYVSDINSVTTDMVYAISGVPTVRNGDDVDYYKYVQAQGFDTSCMYATWRHWLGIKGGEIWLITGKTTTANYIYGMEFWKKVKGEGFDDIICIDGGSSYYYKNGKKAKTTMGSRQVNNLVVF